MSEAIGVILPVDDVVPSADGVVMPDDGVFDVAPGVVPMSEFIGCCGGWGEVDGADGVVGVVGVVEDGAVEVDGDVVVESVDGFMPSFVVPVGGVVPSGAGVVVSVPPGGVGAGWVWAKAAVPTSKAAAKAIDFITFTPLLRRGAGVMQSRQCLNGDVVSSFRPGNGSADLLKPPFGIERIAGRTNRADDVGMSALVDRLA